MLFRSISEISLSKSWSISGFGGGNIANLCNQSIMIHTNDIEIAQDIQLVVMHCIKQALVNVLAKNTSDALYEFIEPVRHIARTSLNKIS